MIPTTSAGLSQSLNQRFLRLALANESSPEERAKRVASTEESLIPKVVASCVLWARRGAKIGDEENLYFFEPVQNGKTYVQRCMEL